jgi:flagellar biogenesis protein FliO
MRNHCARQLKLPDRWKGPLKLAAALVACLLLLAVTSAMQARQGQAQVTEPTPAESRPATTQPAEAPAGETQPSTQPTSKPAESGEYLFARRDKTPLRTRPDSSSGVMGRMLVLVVIILAVGGVVLFLIRRYLPRTRPSKPGRRIELLESSMLGPGKAIHLFRVGGRELLLGVTKDRISMLAEITDSAQANRDGETFRSALDAAEEAGP